MLEQIQEVLKNGKSISEREALTAILELLIEINEKLNKIIKKK